MRWRSIALVGGAALVLASAATAARAPSPTPRHWSTDAPPAPAAATVATHKDDASLGGVGVGGGARGAAAVAHAAPRKLPPLLPLTASTAATLVLAAIALAVAAAGGIGGGGVLVPLYLLLLGAPPRDAVALSNATILGGAIASLAFNVQRVTAAGAPVIDWDVVLAMEPSTVVGAVAGAIANKVVPGWLTTASLTLLLAAMTAKLAARAREARQAENDARRSDGEGLLAAEAPKPPSLAGVPDEPPPGPAFPLAKVAALGGLCAVVAASDGAKKAVRCGSPAYWAASLAVLPPALFLAWRTRVRLLAETAAAGQGSAAAGHVRWTRRTTLLFPALSTAAGAVAGLFGVGGGIVKAPLMLELGVPPDVAAATSVTMILFTSASASVVYLSFGMPRDYAAALFCLGVVSTAAGQAVLSASIDRTGRRSTIVAAMAAFMAASVVAVGYESSLLIARAAKDHAWRAHGRICPRQGPPMYTVHGL